MTEFNDVRGGNFNSRAIFKIAVAMLFSLVLIGLAILIFFNSLANGRPGARLRTQAWDRALANAPAEIDSGKVLAELRQQEDLVLHGLGWVDRNAGIVHLPIEQAMTILIERDRERPRGR